MRILNKKEFLALPAGVIYNKFEPNYFDTLSIKGYTILSVEDFYYTPITYPQYNCEEVEALAKHGKVKDRSMYDWMVVSRFIVSD